MDTSTDVRQRIYLSCRAIFSGQSAQFRKHKIVKKLVRKHRSTLHPLIEELQEWRLIDFIRQLLQEEVFQSISRAEQEFPQLFLSSPAQDAEREASEAGAALLVEQALMDDTSSDDEEYLPAEEVHTPVLVEQGIQSGMFFNYKGGEISFAYGLEAQTQPPVPPPALPTGHTAVPSIYPTFYPYHTQHLIMTSAQQILEECCFDFAQAWIPDVVQAQGWDCAAAVELSKWATIMKKRTVPVQALNLPPSSSVHTLLSRTHKLRHTAVHRLATPARGISELLGPAVRLAEALRDENRAAQLRRMKAEVDDKIEAMELTKNVLKNEAVAKLSEIQRQREELDKQEAEAVEKMQREDGDNKLLVGRLIEEAVGSILNDKAGMAENQLEVNGDSYSDDSDAEAFNEFYDDLGVD